MSAAATNARAALLGRFSPGELSTVLAQPYGEALVEARRRRAGALAASRWAETPEAARETPVIVALHAFITEQEPAAPLVPWEGDLL